MKNGLFGKSLSLALALIMLFALSSCGKNETVEYDITGKSDFSVADTTFDGDVFITGEIVPFSGQEANMHNVAKWTENGEEVNFHLAIFAE